MTSPSAGIAHHTRSCHIISVVEAQNEIRKFGQPCVGRVALKTLVACHTVGRLAPKTLAACFLFNVFAICGFRKNVKVIAFDVDRIASRIATNCAFCNLTNSRFAPTGPFCIF